MRKAQWQAHIIYHVHRHDHEECSQVPAIAQRLADLDLATDALIAAGYGTSGDDIREIAANIIEARPIVTRKEKGHGEIAQTL